MRHEFYFLSGSSLKDKRILAIASGVPGRTRTEIGTLLRNDVSLLLAAVPFLFIFGAFSLFGENLDLVLQQKREAARRRACAVSKLAVNDANMHTLSIPGKNYHFTQLIVEPPISDMDGRPSGSSYRSASSNMNAAGYAVISGSEWVNRKGKREHRENQISEAEENIQRWEQQLRTIEMDCAPYAIPDKEGYIKSKSEELERWIEGERYFIHLARKRLAGL